MKTFLKILGALALLVAIAWYPLVMDSPPPSDAYPLDMAKVRAAAEALSGAKASAVRFERILDMKFYESMLLAGDPFTPTRMPVYSYQLVFPQSTIIVDTAMPLESVDPQFLAVDYDAAAYGRMSAAMEKAAQIVITHEHMDHIGGIGAHPHLKELQPALRLTTEQFENRKGMKPVELPAAAMAGYQPLEYAGILAIAPGVVLIKAPGHTPGSQLVFVSLADGREMLFIGDVSWRLRNLELIRERPRFMTAMIGENREQVIAQMTTLHALMEHEPKLAIVPGHDRPAVDALAQAGFLQQGFQ